MQRRPNPRGFLLLCTGLVAAGLLTMPACTRTPVEDTKIAAGDSTEFFRWKRDTLEDLPPARREQFETALEELRLDIMFKHEASGHDAIEAALCQRLNHRSIKVALLNGAQLKWQRLAAERDDLQRVLNANARLVTKPGDQAAAADLDAFRAKQQQRMTADAQELATLEQQIQSLGGPAPHLATAAPATQPVAATHTEALQQIGGLLESRRNASGTRYSPAPAKVDWDGAELDGSIREEFLAKKAAAVSNGKVVLPVRIKGHWLLYEAPDQAPALPDDVRAQLSVEELAKFKHDWLEGEAELWAREVGKDFSAPPSPPNENEPPDTPPMRVRG